MQKSLMQPRGHIRGPDDTLPARLTPDSVYGARAVAASTVTVSRRQRQCSDRSLVWHVTLLGAEAEDDRE